MSVFDESEFDSVEEVLESVQNSGKSVQTADGTLDEAVARIEEANLWKTLYSTEVFPTGSAREEIRTRLNDKLKQIALEEIQVLLGMTQVTRGSLLADVASEAEREALLALMKLDSQQISALTKLANKVLQRSEPIAPAGAAWTPKVSTISNSDNSVLSAPKINTMPTQANKGQSQVVTKKESRPQQKRKGQAKPQGIKPIPPASAETLLAQGAIKIPQASLTGDTSNGIGQAIGNVINSLTQGNILHVDTNKAEEGEDVNERF